MLSCVWAPKRWGFWCFSSSASCLPGQVARVDVIGGYRDLLLRSICHDGKVQLGPRYKVDLPILWWDAPLASIVHASSRHLAKSCLVLCQRAWVELTSSTLASPWLHVLGASCLAPDQLPHLLALHASVHFPAQIPYLLSAVSTSCPEANNEGNSWATCGALENFWHSSD